MRWKNHLLSYFGQTHWCLYDSGQTLQCVFVSMCVSINNHKPHTHICCQTTIERDWNISSPKNICCLFPPWNQKKKNGIVTLCHNFDISFQFYENSSQFCIYVTILTFLLNSTIILCNSVFSSFNSEFYLANLSFLFLQLFFTILH